MLSDMADPYTKFEVFSVSRCGDIGVKFQNVSRDLTTPHSGYIFHRQLGLATINLRIKFKVSNYTNYEDMKSGAECTNWGSWGRLGVTQGHHQCHHSRERI